ncbi:MAG: hypothetical protein IJV36_00520 [Prevotella sp.]|nr:hypothetical protein [Prevotella sp.]
METKRNITDAQLDDLIMASLERKEIAADIAEVVMKDLRRAERRLLFRRWGRAVAFAFGLPLVLLAFGWLFSISFVQQGEGSPFYVCLAFPVVAMLYFAYRAVENFSAESV